MIIDLFCPESGMERIKHKNVAQNNNLISTLAMWNIYTQYIYTHNSSEGVLQQHLQDYQNYH